MDRHMRAQLICEDGTVYNGYSFGAAREVVGELVFSTGLTSMLETLTDHAAAGKLLVMAYPLMGNFGVTLEDMESEWVQAAGLIVREKCDRPSNFRCEMDLAGLLKQTKTPGIYGIDTRSLVRRIRDKGSMRAVITTRGETMTKSQIKQKFENIAQIQAFEAQERVIAGGGKHIAVLDMGAKRSFIAKLTALNYKLTILPVNATAERVLATGADMVLVTSGAGEPNSHAATVSTLATLLGRIPMAGIGLGYLLIAKAAGCMLEKLTYGHHGQSYALKDTRKNSLCFAAMSMDYYVSEPASGVTPFLRNINDNHIEGIILEDKRAFGVSFYPQNEIVPNNTAFFYDMLQTL